MTLVGIDEEGLQRAGEALDAGAPVVIPMPVPLPYVLAGSDAAALNAAKGRPPAQPLGMVVADFAPVARYLDLDEDTSAFARWLAADQLLNLFVPVGDGSPAWMRPSTSNGWLGLMLACPEAVRALLDKRGHLYVSSANRTGGEVAVTAAAANLAFDDELLVIDGDAERDPSVPAGSATIVRVGPQRRLEVVRGGINDAGFAGDTDGFLREVRRRWEAGERP